MPSMNGFANIKAAQANNLARKSVLSVSNDQDTDYAHQIIENGVAQLHKATKALFTDVITELYNSKVNGRKMPTINDEMYKIIMKNADRLNSSIIHDRDFNFTNIGFKLLEQSYLLKVNGNIVERPQHMLMRVAVGIHGADIDAAIETYNLLSEQYFLPDPSTLLAIGKPQPQLSSCFLLSMVEDSMIGIYETLTRCAQISRFSGAIGLNINCIRAKGSTIASSGGASTGLVPMLRVFNETAHHADHGGKQPGSIAIYLEPWHADVFDFLNLRKSAGHEEERCHYLQTALWIPDLFMKRVESDEMWSLMCPHKSPNLYKVWGDEFETLYTNYENEGQYVRQVKARDLWFQIVQSQINTGTPYILYKDTCNRKSNQQNLGTIRGGSFCTEIVQYTDCDEAAVCHQASIAVNKFVQPGKTFDFGKLKEVTKIVARNLNKIIDVNFHPLVQSEKSNKRHRPIGIGIQGLADAFILMRLPYESVEAAKLNQQIFETIYYGALEASCELAERDGPYETYEGSPVSKGILQFDMWDKTPTDLWDWAKLKQKIAVHGLRNCLLLGAMQTQSSAQIFGTSNSFEPYTSNILSHRISNTKVLEVNPHLVKDLTELGMWDDEMKAEIIAKHGSIQSIERIPSEIRELYKTSMEMSIKTMMNMAADRGAFIDQSQSFNIYASEPNYAKMSSMHFYAWKLDLKTGMYQIRNQTDVNYEIGDFDANLMSAVEAARPEKMISDFEMAAMVCSLNNREDCMMCGA